jgi:uncharacterized protein (TIGR01319 family)
VPLALCVDFGSTFTKCALVDVDTGEVLSTDATATTIGTDVLDGYRTLLDRLPGGVAPDQVRACSSAGGGLRLAVVGYEREVTAQAGHRVGLSAGAKIVHVAAGPMTGADLAELRAARPDLVLLVGGTDGGNAEVLVHNAARLARARITTPVVAAGNAEAAPRVAAELASTGRRFTQAPNVLPRIGEISPDGARAAIREAFLTHVIGGKGLSRGPEFATLVRAATPDAMLTGVEVLAEAVDGDVMVVDIGGATTDVYSVITPQGEDAGLAKDVVAPLWRARTVEADLGMRWNAEGIVEAAQRERIRLSTKATRYAARLAGAPAHLPGGEGEQTLEAELARAAALVGARRHGRPGGPGQSPRPLADVATVVGSGGVLRHASASNREAVLGAIAGDHGGGWRPPAAPALVTDTAYLLFAVGLLAGDHPRAAASLARRVVGGHP